MTLLLVFRSRIMRPKVGYYGFIIPRDVIERHEELLEKLWKEGKEVIVHVYTED